MKTISHSIAPVSTAQGKDNVTVDSFMEKHF